MREFFFLTEYDQICIAFKLIQIVAYSFYERNMPLFEFFVVVVVVVVVDNRIF